MHIRKKVRTRLIIAAAVILLFVYWRGMKQVATKNGLTCEYHIIYSLCTLKGKTAKLPGFWDIMKAGVSF